MPEPTSVLYLDDDESLRTALGHELQREFADVRLCATAEEATREIAATEPDVLLLDLNLGGARDGLAVLEEVRTRAPSVEVVMLTAFGTIDVAVAAMRAGAFDFVTKPADLESLCGTLRRAAERGRLVAENRTLRGLLGKPARELIGVSPAMDAVRAMIQKAGPADAPILVQGPTGSGKELVARAIHAASTRAGTEMITVNCAALQATLLESELFGHERGAFTGATQRRIGLYELAHDGTLFLDEIGELPLDLQPKLLRAIQFGEVRRVGAPRPRTVDVRIIAATNIDLRSALDEDRFREDLFYRLNVITIDILPLRNRPEDIEPLFAHLAGRHGLNYELSPAHFEVMRAYAWPGNVRELENFIERLCILRRNQPPTIAELRRGLAEEQSVSLGLRPLADIERETIESALAHLSGDREAAAQALGISVRKLYYRLSQYKDQEPGEHENP